jgi:hypothetical protein
VPFKFNLRRYKTDPAVLASWQAKGCLVWSDTGLAGKPGITSADAIFVDLLLVGVCVALNDAHWSALYV